MPVEFGGIVAGPRSAAAAPSPAAVLASGYRGGKGAAAAERGPATIPPNSTGTGSLARVSDEPMAFTVNAPPPAVTTPPATSTGSVARLSNEPLDFKVTAPPAEPVVTTPPSTGTGSVARLSNEPLAFKANAPAPPVIPPPTGTNAPASGPPPQVPPPQALTAAAPPAPAAAPLATGYRLSDAGQRSAARVQGDRARVRWRGARARSRYPAAAAAVPKMVLNEVEQATRDQLTAAGMDSGEATRRVWNAKVKEIERAGEAQERRDRRGRTTTRKGRPEAAARCTAGCRPRPATGTHSRHTGRRASRHAATRCRARGAATVRGTRRRTGGPTRGGRGATGYNGPRARARATGVAGGRKGRAGRQRGRQRSLCDVLGLEEPHQAADAANTATRKATQHLDTQEIRDYAAQFTNTQVVAGENADRVPGPRRPGCARAVIADILAGKP